uniref:Uncharacterized protein n=1 Tax=Timspurckia oligopyrenoides TaxID=708627 RepID=A0A7S0ZHK5_9RHOD|mmetsp:Transcript_5577/g.9804  ORF Transcript_5577/g.9804 Transcript_5577/m.9804 type:complete len:289 (+) Transcript_5577:77-943(+)
MFLSGTERQSESETSVKQKDRQKNDKREFDAGVNASETESVVVKRQKLDDEPAVVVLNDCSENLDSGAIHWLVDDEKASGLNAESENLKEIFDAMAAQFGVFVGGRIQVAWDLTGDSDDNSRSVWWGSEIINLGLKVKSPKNVENRLFCRLKYDAFEEFAQQISDVELKDKSELIDLETEAELMWRIEEHDTDQLELIEQNETLTMVDVLEDQTKVDEEEGESIETLGQSEFAKLPILQQQHLAAKYRSFADEVKLGLQKIRERKGTDCEITRSDVESILQNITAQGV